MGKHHVITGKTCLADLVEPVPALPRLFPDPGRLAELADPFQQRIACLAVVAGVHAIAYVAGLLWMKRQERGEPLLLDERDRAIDGRATRTAYFVLLTGMIVVGVVMPFSDSGWKLTNTALFAIVLAETVRYALIVAGYRRTPRLAH